MTETVVVLTASAGIWLEEADGACPAHGLWVPPRLRDSGDIQLLSQSSHLRGRVHQPITEPCKRRALGKRSPPIAPGVKIHPATPVFLACLFDLNMRNSPV